MNKADELLAGVPADIADDPWVKAAIEELRTHANSAGLSLEGRNILIGLATEEYAWGSDDNIEVDDNARFSIGDAGVWVEGWLFVSKGQCRAAGFDSLDFGDDDDTDR